MRMEVKAKFGIFSKKIIPFKYKKFYKEFKDAIDFIAKYQEEVRSEQR